MLAPPVGFFTEPMPVRAHVSDAVRKLPLQLAVPVLSVVVPGVSTPPPVPLFVLDGYCAESSAAALFNPASASAYAFCSALLICVFR